MNVTPLIDVLLVLIIVFMVVVSMDKSQGFDTQIPQPPKSPNEPPPPERTIVIQVEWTQEGQPPALKINSENVKWAACKVSLLDVWSEWRSCVVTMTSILRM
jgi:biopolymer transport protein ExbD